MSGNDRDDGLWAFMCVACVVVVAMAMVLSKGCSDGPTAQRVLRSAGYTNIETGSWEFGCGNGDNQCTGFTATGPSGYRVRGVVGCGWFVKGCTIRTSP